MAMYLGSTRSHSQQRCHWTATQYDTQVAGLRHGQGSTTPTRYRPRRSNNGSGPSRWGQDWATTICRVQPYVARRGMAHQNIRRKRANTRICRRPYRTTKTTAKQNPAMGNTYHRPSTMLGKYVARNQVCLQMVTAKAEAMARDDTHQMQNSMLARPSRGQPPPQLTQQIAAGEQPGGRITRQPIPERMGPKRSLESIWGVEYAAEAPPQLPLHLKQAAETLHHKV